MHEYSRDVLEPFVIDLIHKYPSCGYYNAWQAPENADKTYHVDVIAFEKPGNLNSDIIAHLVYMDVKTVSDVHLKTGNYTIGSMCIDYWMSMSYLDGALNSYRTVFQIIENGHRTDRFKIIKTIDLLGFIISKCS